MLAVFILLWCYPVVGQELSPSVCGRISSAIVRIETEESSGTGFIIRRDGTIVTALGIIDGAAHVKVTTENREVYDNVSLLTKDERRGIAIIRTACFGLSDVDFGDSDSLEEEQVLMIGRTFAAGEMSLTCQLSRVSGVSYSDRGHKIVLIADPIPDEAVGGPIVDTDGRVIAIAVFQEDWKSAIPINYVRGLLDYVGHNQPILQWGSEHGTEGPWSRFLVFWRGILTAIYNSYPWLITFLVAGLVIYCRISLLYSRRASEAEKYPWLAPISVSGKLFADFNAREAAIEIDANMFGLVEIAGPKRNIKELNIASLSQSNLPVDLINPPAKVIAGGEVTRRLIEAPGEICPPRRLRQTPELRLPDVAEIGLFSIPIGLVVTLAKMLFWWIPIPFRKRYQEALIHVSLMSIGPEAHLCVWRGNRYLLSPEGINSETSDVESNQTTASGRTGNIALLHDAVFMILELMQDTALPGRNWLGKKYFVEGVEYLDRSLRTCQQKLMTKAIESFLRAAEADDKNYEALYIKGHILNSLRKEDSNKLAEELLKRALNTEENRLKALVHAELANCYAQQYFRLARRKADVIKRAQEHINDAYECWKQGQAEEELPEEELPLAWILAADALIHVLQARSKDQKSSESIKLYGDAAKLYFEAAKIEENNNAYLNALGFILLMLTEQGETDLDLGIPTNNLNIPQLSENYFRMSLEVDPSNKLVHANLCLLYATKWYQDENCEKYLELSHKHGLKAVELDPQYVHGYRDLAKSLLRYNKIEEARDRFKEAMNLAQGSEKKKEIKCEIESVLDEMGISKEEWCD